MMILILDDNIEVLAGMSRLVSDIFSETNEFGYRTRPGVFECDTASRAIAVMSMISPDIAILDIDLGSPKESGTHVLHWIRTNRPALADRTVMMSGTPYDGHPHFFLKGTDPMVIREYLRLAYRPT